MGRTSHTRMAVKYAIMPPSTRATIPMKSPVERWVTNRARSRKAFTWAW